MRISTAMFNQKAIAGIGERTASIAEVQESLTTSRRVNRASDDPMAAAEAERLRSSQTAMAIDKRMMGHASSMLTQAESALAAGGDLLQDARELLVSAGNGSYGREERNAIAVQLQGIHDELLALANQSDGSGGRVFGSQGGAAAPFSATGEATGAANPGTRQTGLGMAFDTTVDGHAVFLGDGGPVDPATGSIFAALDTIVGVLKDPLADGQALTDALGDALDATDHSLGRLRSARTDIGEQLRAIDSRTRLVEAGELRAQTRMSELVDTDYAAAIGELNMHQLAQNAAMRTYVQISRLSLFDYL